jgi:hypothetical protein
MDVPKQLTTSGKIFCKSQNAVIGICEMTASKQNHYWDSNKQPFLIFHFHLQMISVKLNYTHDVSLLVNEARFLSPVVVARQVDM